MATSQTIDEDDTAPGPRRDATRRTIATYRDYATAERAVD